MTDTVQCIECARLTLRIPREMGRLGFGSCGTPTGGAYVSPTYPRKCSKFRQAESEIIEPRRVYLQKLGMRANTTTTNQGEGLP